LRGGSGGASTVDRCNKAVAAARHRLDKSWVLGRVAQRITQAPDRRIQAVIEVNEGVSRPELSTELLTRYDLARLL
jgi:hypothetical protein